ncbi:MAG: nucleotidyltransferase domain-containing protein, partial [Prochlorococcaceae cyanobacterium]
MTASSRPSTYHYVVDEPLLRTIAAEIQAAIPGAEVRLFGSRARGTARPDSDFLRIARRDLSAARAMADPQLDRRGRGRSRSTRGDWSAVRRLPAVF